MLNAGMRGLNVKTGGRDMDIKCRRGVYGYKMQEGGG